MVFRELFFVLGILHAAANTEVSVRMNDDMTGNIGSNTTISCYYTAKILSVQIMARYKNEDDFNTIVTFIPGRAVVLSKYGKHLQNRSVLSNITTFSREAAITIENLTCYDEGTYKCKITYINSDTRVQESLTSTQVNLSTTDLKEILTYKYLSDAQIDLNSQSLVEGENITFVCRGNVGRPQRKCVWQQFFDNRIVRNLTDTNPELYELNDSCIYYQSTNVTIKVSSKDHRTKMRCSVYSEVSQQEMYRETHEMDVFYKVKTPTISKIPDKLRYTEGLDNHINLTCHSDGNPEPNYKWYFKSENMNKSYLSSDNTFKITDISVNRTGRYICRAQNSIDRISYEEENSENITIEETTKTSSGGSSTLGFGIFGDEFVKVATTLLIIFIL